MAYTARTVSWAIGKAYVEAKMKATAPTSGNKFDSLISMADTMQKNWAAEPGVEWNSLFELYTLTPVVTATATFALHNDIQYLSKGDNQYVIVTDGTQEKRYRVVKATQLDFYREQDACAQVGRNLKFSKAFASDSSLLGYNIKVPAIKYANDLTASTDTIQVDEPLWVAYMMAADFVRNDVTKKDQYDNLIEYANVLMNKMKELNGGTIDVIPTSSATVGSTFAEGATW